MRNATWAVQGAQLALLSGHTSCAIRSLALTAMHLLGSDSGAAGHGSGSHAGGGRVDKSGLGLGSVGSGRSRDRPDAWASGRFFFK